MKGNSNKKSLFKLSVGGNTTDKDLEREAKAKQMEDIFSSLDVMFAPADMPSVPSLDIDKEGTSNSTSKKDSSTDVLPVESTTNSNKSDTSPALEKSKKSNLFDEIASFSKDIPRIEALHSTASSIFSISKDIEQEKQPLSSKIEKVPPSIKVIECDESVRYISEKWSETPCGIIECQVSHIGATYLEMGSDRDSIIVFPDESEAYRNSKKYSNSLYVSKEIGEEDISDYIQKQSRHKFIATPNSAGKLLYQLSKEGQEEDVAKKYFFMVKDMEQLQAESTYKADNGKVLDFYLKFPKGKRCIYTTDYRAFTHPVLNNEEVHVIKWKNLPKRNIKVISCSNIIGALKEAIEKLPAKDKVLVVYTSIQQARLAILNLKEDMQKECCIWCREFNKEEAGKFFKAIGESKSLPKRITFLGYRDYNLQIKGKCHLIIVSDTNKGSTLMSIKDIIKVYSLCKPTNILSDTVIHNEAACHWQWEMEINVLVERAEKIVKLLNTADELSEGDNSLKRLFSIVGTTLRNKATGRIRGRLPNIKLIRRDYWSKDSAAYMNIDSLLLRVNLSNTYYSKPTTLAKALKELYSITSSEPNNNEEIPEAQQEIEKEEKKRQSAKKLKERIAILDEILKLHINNKLNQEYLDEKGKKGSSIHRKVYKEVAKLYSYMGTEELIDNLKHIESGNKIGFNNFNNKVIYWSLVENHPLRLSVNEAFKVGEKYTNAEIREKMNSIIQYHFHRDWSENTRKPITLFKCFFETERPKREYIIKSELSFKCHKDRIDKNEDDLLKLFIISDTQANKKSKKPQSEKS